MNRTEIDFLLEKYFNGTISGNEMELLRQLSNLCSDEQLKLLFVKQWDAYTPLPEFEETEIKKVSNRIDDKLQKKNSKARWTRFIRVAAAVLLLFTTGVSAYLMIDNRTMATLGKREVMVKVDKGQRVGMTLPDGSTVQLNSESVLSYRQDFGKENRSVKFAGEAFFEVVKSGDKKFLINSRFMDIEVLGTSFNFYAYESKDEVELTLINGKVFLSTTTSPVQTAMLEPNSKAVYNKKTKLLDIRPTDTSFETAWRVKELVFRSEPLSHIFPKIERRHGVSFAIKDPGLLDELYTGVFDHEEISDVIKILSTHFYFTYKIKADSVLIY